MIASVAPKAFRYAVVEDEPLAMRVLVRMLASLAPDAELAWDAADGDAAFGEAQAGLLDGGLHEGIHGASSRRGMVAHHTPAAGAARKFVWPAPPQRLRRTMKPLSIGAKPSRG